MPVLTNRLQRRFAKTWTFDGGTTHGAIAQDTLGTVTGTVLIVSFTARCTTALTGASATMSLGTANTVDGLVAVTTATDLDANEFWKDAGPESESSFPVTDILLCADLTLDVLVATVDTGVVEFVFYWLPISDDGNIA